MKNKVEIIQEFSRFFAGIDVQFLPNNDKNIQAYTAKIANEKLGLQMHTPIPSTKSYWTDHTHIYEFSALQGIFLLSYADTNSNQILFVGPIVTEQFSSTTLLSYLRYQNISPQTITKFDSALHNLPRLSYADMYHYMDLLLKHLCNITIPIPVRKITQKWNINPFTLVPHETQYQHVNEIRRVENRYETSIVLTEAVKQGNLSMALQALDNRNEQSDMSPRNPNPLRNIQNQCIILNTQLRHALEGNKIHPYQLDIISRDIGLQIERLHSVDAAVTFIRYIIEQYCKIVQEQSYQNLSNLVHQAVIYVKNNLCANITVSDTAKELSVHPDYLSHQFRCETGMNFITFVNQERCKQAASFLQYTPLQVKQISAIVGFNTISYFTKQFVRLYGKTPRDYRRECT